MAWTTPRTWATGETVTATLMNTHVRDNLNALGGTWTAYTPAIGGTGWSIGTTGSAATGWYLSAGKLTLFQAALTFGTVGATFGSGAMTISIPVTGAHNTFGAGYANHAGTWYPVTFIIAAGSAVVTMRNNASPLANVVSTVPFTWAAADAVTINGFVEST